MNKKVLFNIPNLICYLRIVLLVVFIRSSNILYYIISASLDFLDGYTARKFNQCTFIGSVLDMCIDRASNLVILLISPTAFSYNPKFSYLSCDFLIYLVLLDFISHFICFVVNVKRNTHHKVVSGILSIYYNKKVLFTLCGGAELFFLFMFKGTGLKDYFVVFYYVKSFFHFVQLINAMKEGSEIK